ncbi:selenocysteine-specific translation elongation factor [Acetonema longum]|uniref:Selenocysteine-specific elongation factor n=1 Tax=Acetonema longum DSM 6540 TaxID=1009370 RepID=F7NIF5_9FIRM|nr:selenocysteine-specific translation elongation factor [Acetonema longum]EGO64185.1 selenocysteine-specific translation elongation factor [Acetonema longum DSM 6540]
MKYLIIGTAGHVDHGKTALIKALTGQETDRLKEEKERGISIDLGFAFLPLAEDLAAGIVDVPGHERFLKNMLAGTGSIDLAMLVVAADEGVMPQTREHLAMLELYGIRHGLIALNKIDKVEPDWLELVEAEIRTEVQHTFLAQAPICRVSAATGQGIQELLAALRQLSETVPARDRRGPFRMWIDRVFNVKGHGLVVTGSALTGSVSSGDSLALYPQGQEVRVRGLEWHDRKVARIYAGQRAALNLAGAEQEEVARGMLLSQADCSQVSNRWDAFLIWREEPANGIRVRLHLGTGEYIGRLYRNKGETFNFMQLVLEQALSATAGDRGILRLYSPQKLLGGVMLLAPGRLSRRISPARRDLATALKRGDSQGILQAVILDELQPLSTGELLRRTGYLSAASFDTALEGLLKANKVMRLDSFIFSISLYDRLWSVAREILQDFHRIQPEKAGMEREGLRQKLQIGEKEYASLLHSWETAGRIKTGGAVVALESHASRHGCWQKNTAEQLAQAMDATKLDHIDVSRIEAIFALPGHKAEVMYEQLIRQGALIRVGDLCVYSKTIQYIVDLIQRCIQEKGGITVAEFRDMLQTSRKMAVPVLEYCDMHKYTIRDGDIRRLGPKTLKVSE